MKIAIPVTDKTDESKVSSNFGRAPYFLIFDSKTNTKNYILNDSVNSPSGAGVKAAQILANARADVLITPRLGENASLVIREAGIKIYETSSLLIEETLKAFEEGKLSLLTRIHEGLHHGR